MTTAGRTPTTRREALGGRAWIAVAVFVVAVVAAASTSAGTVPPSAPVIAAFVAAVTLGLPATTALAIGGVVACVGLALADDLDGGALLGQILFAAGTGALAVALAAATRPRAHTNGNGEPADDVTLAAALMHARTVEDVSATAVEQAAQLFGATVARLAVRRERDLFTYVGDSLPPALHGEHAMFSLHGEDPAAAVLRAGVPSYWPRFRTFERRHPRAARVLQYARPASIALLPLIGDRQPIGVWVLAFDEPRSFDRIERRNLEQSAAETTVALERALLSEFERSVATELQNSLLGPPVLVEGAGHCTRYRAAVSRLTVGGDWYDTIPLGRGRIGVAVGDAVGRGLVAATVMGQLRSALGACALRAGDAADAIDCLDEFASNLSAAASTTVAYAIVDLKRHVVEYCSAGHPPPLCVSPDGSAQFLEDAQTWPLAIGLDRPRSSARHQLEPGSLLVLYSDGLVERRRESLDVGLQRLAVEASKRARLPIDQLADELLDAMLAGSEGSDDVVLLLLRAPVLSPDMLLRKMKAVPDELRRIRADVRTWLHEVGLEDDRASDVLVAVGEACTNVVQHAYTDELHRLVRIEGAVIDDKIVVTITDTGTWKESSAHSVGGRGMRLMRSLVPTVEYQRRTSGTSVTFRYPMERSKDRTPVPV